MTLPKSVAAFSDCEDLFEQALASDKGIAITLETHGQAVALRLKLNTYRERLRKTSRKVYPEDDPKHGVSPYDKFKVTLDKDNNQRLRIELNVISPTKVEKL